MRKYLLLVLLSFSLTAFSQVITEEEFTLLLVNAQEKCAGAHGSVVQRTNEEFGLNIWEKKIRFNQASIVRFFTHSAGEKVSAGVDILKNNPGAWVYTYDQKTAAGLLRDNGLKVTLSYNTQWISARQDLLYAESIKDGKKTILELYCPRERFLDLLRTGQTQSIEFLITGYKGSNTSSAKIYGVLTEVYAEKQVFKCSNGHEFDKALGYKFCPDCGEPLE